MKVIRLHGLRRTGTNYLQQLIQANLQADVHINLEAWKHGPLGRCAEFLPAVATVRHPLSWLVSLWRIQRNHPSFAFLESFEDFILWRRHPAQHEGECPAIHRWTYSVGYWLFRQESHGALIVRFEDALTAPAATLRAIQGAHGLESKGVGLTCPEEYVGPHKRRETRAGIVKREQARTYLSEWTPQMLAHVKARVDPDILQAVGYQWDV